MSIQELPASAIRLIGSSQAITDPASVVKELVDNALDAGCQGVSVEVSNDTLETIQVRDNGRGIAPEDRPLLCKPHCTSKIRQFSDIGDVGGQYLGFRGEALARIAEISGCFTVTTRVEGESVGAGFTFRNDGRIEREECASHPFGTTVRVTDLFRNIPVRRQTALKKRPETLAKMKRLMQAYAFTRPKVRLSLKILKAKDSKSHWNYVPKSNGIILDTAREVVGNECAKNCSYLELETDGYLVQSLLPNVQANTAAINNIGLFLSVDSRSVSSSRGVLKQVLKACKEELKDNVCGDLRNPFLWMNIACPSRSYDPNVELAKDDLVFEDKDKLLGAVHALLASRYSKFEKPSDTQMTKDKDIQVCESNMQCLEQSEDDGSPKDTYSRKRKFFATSMYNLDDDELQEPLSHTGIEDDTPSSGEEGTQRGLRDPNVSNPWIIAKLHSSTKNKQPKQVLETSFRKPLRPQRDSETNIQSNGQPYSHAPMKLPEIVHAAAMNPTQQLYQTDIQTVAGNYSNGHDLLEYPQGMPVESVDEISQTPVQESSQAEEDPSTWSQDRSLRAAKEGRPIDDPIIPENKPRLRKSHQTRQLNQEKFKPPRHPSKQKPFILPLKQETRNWFRQASKHQSSSKAGLSGVSAEGRGIDIRMALFNAPEMTPAPVDSRSQTGATLARDNGVGQVSLTEWLQHENSATGTLEPVLAVIAPQAEGIMLEQIRGCGKSEELIWSSSLEWFTRNSDKYSMLSTTLFGSVHEDVHEPIWGTAMVSYLSSSSFLSPIIRHEEIDEWADRLMQLLYENKSLQQLGACSYLRRAELKIARAITVHVANEEGKSVAQ